MRAPTRLLVLPLLLAALHHAKLGAQTQPARAVADSMPASVRWNRLVPRLVDENAARRRAIRKAATAAGDSATLRRLAQTPQPFLFRVYSVLGLAQYGAASSARDDRGVSSDAAVAAASAAVLTELYADSAVRATIAGELARDVDRAQTRASGAARVTAGRRLGEDVASRVIAWAPPQAAMAAPWSGTIPKGPGMWTTAPGVPPIGILFANARPWLLDSASQFRPAPPPAFDSPTFKAALDEVKRVARERTPEQTKIAQRWNSADPWARWNDVASAAAIRVNSARSRGK